jgi:phospholipase/carboxylesterase
MTFHVTGSDALALRSGPRSPTRLAIFLHGVGATPESLGPVANFLFDGDTACVLLGGPDLFDGGIGRQWFSVAGVTTENRPARVAAALPGVTNRISAIISAEGVGAHNVTIAGFSQGAIMTLALAASGYVFRQALSLSGLLASTVAPASPFSPAILLSHGTDDSVIPVGDSETAARTFSALGFNVEFDPVLRLGHQTSPTQLSNIRERLQGAA